MIKKIFLLCIFLFNFFLHALTLDNINKDYITKDIVNSLNLLENSVQISSINKENYLLIKDRLIKNFIDILNDKNLSYEKKTIHHKASVLYASLIYIYNFLKLEKPKKVKEFIAEINKIEDNFFLSLTNIINDKNIDILRSNFSLQEINEIVELNSNFVCEKKMLLNNDLSLIDLIIKNFSNYREQYVSRLIFFLLFYGDKNKQIVNSKNLSLNLNLDNWYFLCNIYANIRQLINSNCANIDINSIKIEVDDYFFIVLKNSILATYDNIFSAFDFIYSNEFIYSTIMTNSQKVTFREFLLSYYLKIEIKKYISELEIKKSNNISLKELEEYKDSILQSYKESLYFFPNEKILIESIVNKNLIEIIIKPREFLNFNINDIIDDNKKKQFKNDIYKGKLVKKDFEFIKKLFDENLKKLLNNIKNEYKKITNYEEYIKAYNDTCKIICDYKIDINDCLFLIDELKSDKKINIKTYEDIIDLIYEYNKELLTIKSEKIEDILKNNQKIYCDDLKYLNYIICDDINGIDVLFFSDISSSYFRKKITLNVSHCDNQNVHKKYLISDFLNISLPVYYWFILLNFREATLLAYKNQDYIFYNQVSEEDYNFLFENLIIRIESIEELKKFEEINKHFFLNINFNNKNLFKDIVNYFFDRELNVIVKEFLITKNYQEKNKKIEELILKYKININSINYENIFNSISVLISSNNIKNEVKNSLNLRNKNLLKEIEKNIQNKINICIPNDEEDIDKILKDVLGNDKQKNKKSKQKKNKKKEKSIKTKIAKKQEKSIEIKITKKQNNNKPNKKPKPKPKKQEFSLVDRIKNTGKKIKKVKKILTNPISLIQNNNIIFSFLSPVLQQRIHTNHVDLMLKYSNNQEQYSNDIKTLCCNLLSELQGLKEFIYYFDQLETKIFLNEQFEEMEYFFADYERSLQDCEINHNKLNYINYNLKRSSDIIAEIASKRDRFTELLNLNNHNLKYNIIEDELCILAEHTQSIPIEEGINSLDMARCKVDNYQKLIDLLGSIKQNFNDLKFYRNNLILIRDTLQKNNNEY